MNNITYFKITVVDIYTQIIIFLNQNHQNVHNYYCCGVVISIDIPAFAFFKNILIHYNNKKNVFWLECVEDVAKNQWHYILASETLRSNGFTRLPLYLLC